MEQYWKGLEKKTEFSSAAGSQY
ncbi:uncharacterized protein METZ01_LOCUS157624 [marine metagenome]|uniref:Uncharacterized protein n=1 Tax=marine metagenome TaxID=408172 RepID=A0A382AT98_9ZZZZ